MGLAFLILAGVAAGLYFLDKLPVIFSKDSPVVEEPLTEAMTVDGAVSQIGEAMVALDGGIFRTSSGVVQGISNFALSKYEVTQAQWRALMGARPTGIKECSQCPVENITWRDAQTFIQLLNERTGG